MPAEQKNVSPNVIPALRYRDARAMIDWLARAFGFDSQFVVDGEGGTIAHAQLTFAGGMIMLGSARDDNYDKLVKTPAALGGTSQSVYIPVDDVDAHHDRAKAAGDEIVMELTDTDYGSRDYICRDPEGHVWCFGTYRP
ncbi:MAG: VOC family protein [Kiloniellales bacterium]|nr:VOC family protein [Kiloniellales bacterium]